MPMNNMTRLPAHGNLSKVRTALAVSLTLLACTLPLKAAPTDWRKLLEQELPLLGHRNWIVIVDSAYPLQSSPGVETIETGASQDEVVRTVLADLSKSKHVAPDVYMDAELPFVPEQGAPGVTVYRAQLPSMLGSLTGAVFAARTAHQDACRRGGDIPHPGPQDNPDYSIHLCLLAARLQILGCCIGSGPAQGHGRTHDTAQIREPTDLTLVRLGTQFFRNERPGPNVFELCASGILPLSCSDGAPIARGRVAARIRLFGSGKGLPVWSRFRLPLRFGCPQEWQHGSDQVNRTLDRSFGSCFRMSASASGSCASLPALPPWSSDRWRSASARASPSLASSAPSFSTHIHIKTLTA